jgi:hypothetical protein
MCGTPTGSLRNVLYSRSESSGRAPAPAKHNPRGRQQPAPRCARAARSGPARVVVGLLVVLTPLQVTGYGLKCRSLALSHDGATQLSFQVSTYGMTNWAIYLYVAEDGQFLRKIRSAPQPEEDSLRSIAAIAAATPSEDNTIRRGGRTADSDATTATDPGVAMPAPEHSRPLAAVCGLPVPLTGKPLFLLLCAGYLGSALGFAALQERVLDIPGFKFTSWMTFVTAATMAVCGMLERLLTRDLNRVGALSQYAALSVLTVSGMGLTNLSLNYLTYPTRVIFKSSKLLPTMAVGQHWSEGLARSSPGGRPLPQKPRRLLGASLRLQTSTRRLDSEARLRLRPAAWCPPEAADPTASDPPPPSPCRWARCCSGGSTPSLSTLRRRGS